MNRILKAIGAVVLASTLIGSLLVLAGLVPITASSGHWWITRAMLEFGKQRALSTQSSRISIPDLNDSDLIQLGRGAYALNCMACHGDLDTGRGGISLGMLPQPPPVENLIENVEPQKLFFVVKNGIKLTGMPAWAAPEREDEVWSVVAYLNSLKQSREEALEPRVSRIEQPPAETNLSTSTVANSVINSCNTCHDQKGSQNRLIPQIAGQSEAYLKDALIAYRDRKRSSGIMQSATASLNEESINQLARHYADQETAPAIESGQPPELGERLAQHGNPKRLIPSCIDCHDPQGVERKPEFPILYGQPKDYLAKQLELFQKGLRGGGDSVHLMQEFAHRLTDDDIKALADYFSKSSQL